MTISDRRRNCHSENLACASCGKPLDNPEQSSVASSMYCQSCLRTSRNDRDRDLPDIYDFSDGAHYDIHASGM